MFILGSLEACSGLLVIIELLSLAVTVEALQAK